MLTKIINKKRLSSLFSGAVLAAFCFQSVAYGETKEEKQIKKLQEKMQRMQQRQANVQEIQNRINQIKSMSANDPASADQRCKAIADSVNYLKNTKSPKRPFDGKRPHFKEVLQQLKKDTQKQAKGITCDQIDFFVPDDSEVDE